MIRCVWRGIHSCTLAMCTSRRLGNLHNSFLLLMQTGSRKCLATLLGLEEDKRNFLHNESKEDIQESALTGPEPDKPGPDCLRSYDPAQYQI
ncbi:hypothetical protein R1flu_029094 [Riccia fluitans]|uniref:Uncharacterized protein n=1 Tax=Riccia fluitans TaxID=41844 RepID=A0ABD1XNL5_9MARC